MRAGEVAYLFEIIGQYADIEAIIATRRAFGLTLTLIWLAEIPKWEEEALPTAPARYRRETLKRRWNEISVDIAPGGMTSAIEILGHKIREVERARAKKGDLHRLGVVIDGMGDMELEELQVRYDDKLEAFLVRARDPNGWEVETMVSREELRYKALLKARGQQMRRELIETARDLEGPHPKDGEELMAYRGRR